MKLRSFFLVCAGALVSLAVSAIAGAQDEMAMQEQSEPAVVEDAGNGKMVDCCCCDSSSMYGDFQFLYLEDYSAGEQLDPGSNEQEGWRVVAGYQCCDGLGFRFRWFDFDGIDGDDDGLDLTYYDLEITDCFSVCCWDGMVSGGYRHGEYSVDGDDDLDFEGDGVTVGLQLYREVCCEGAGLYTWVQHSLLFGDEEEFADDALLHWTELQLGGQYCTCVGGANVVLRGGVEVQYHESLVTDDSSADTGLFGYFISAGFDY